METPGDHIAVAHPLLRTIGEIADRAGIDVYVVGGYVRDLLLGRGDSDIDILVMGDGIGFARTVARETGAGTVVAFERFGTARIPSERGNVEFVGARKERYDPASRNPSVAPATLAEDLLRRDFTVNAMAVSLNRGNAGFLHDPLNGREDMKHRILRTPLDPEQTFDDDPLRMMRAVRFASQLDFSIVPPVLEAIARMVDRLSIVAVERVTDEFLKILATAAPSVGLRLMFDTGMLQRVFPEIALMAGVDQRKDHHHKDVFLHTCMVVDNVAAVSGSLWLRFAALVHDIAKPRTKAFKEGTGWTFHGHE